MELEQIKEYLSWPTKSAQYLLGVDGFISYASKNSKSSDGKLTCPCKKCVNNRILSSDDVNCHLLQFEMMNNYSSWNFHGEIVENIPMSNPSEAMVEDERVPLTSMHQLVHDAYCHSGDDPNMSEKMDEGTHGQNSEAQDFYKLLNDADTELWPGCELTKLSFLVILFHIKSTNKWTNKSFTDLLGALQLAIPRSANLPKSYADANKVTKMLGLGYVQIHSCPNHCQLYWKEKANDDTCSVCGTSRWKRVTEQTTSTGGMKKRGSPAKVLRYFPLKPRLKRIFMSKHTASLMRWHEDERIEDKEVLAHPADSEAWKSFDTRYPEFGKESRNVRLGLASDGFNPFGTMSSTYSCWPIVLVPYNLPPWLCLKKSSLILSTLIPGPTSPGNKIDVYMQPLMEELIELWNVGSETYDASMDETFNMRAGLLWTISDFPAHGMLSGWSVHGENACPVCNNETSSKWLKNGHKYCFFAHRRWLDSNHAFRFNKEAFNGEEEVRAAPVDRTGTDELHQIEEISDFTGSKTWKKKSPLWSLPYWESHVIRHNLDVMHIEKNVCDNVIGTLLNIEGKSKDNLKARHDLEDLGIRDELHAVKKSSGKWYLPPGPYTMSRHEKQVFCRTLHGIKVPNGYAGNISRCVNLQQSKLLGLKSHDCHILMQQILPIALRGLLSRDVVGVLSDLCGYFREVCSKSVRVDDLKRLEKEIPVIMCHLEMIFPPSFFTVMAHLVIHLATQTKLAGPVLFRWMYFIERYLGSLKSHVRNKAHPEASIAEAISALELANFCSHYLQGFNSKLSQLLGIVDYSAEIDSSTISQDVSFFSQVGKSIGKGSTRTITQMSKISSHSFSIVVSYICRLMAKHNGKRLQTSIPNSNRSATSGGHTEQSNNSGNVEGSRTQSDNPLEEGPEYEYEVQDSNGNRRRGKTILADIWNIPEGHQVVIEVNSEMQPIGDEGGVLGAFLGTIARNGNLCSLTYWRWDHLKKGLNKKNEAMILKEVQARFLYPKAAEYWILKSIGHKWRDYKCYLKGKYYNEDDDIALLQSKVPKDVDLNQWVGLVNFWRSDEGKKRSKHGKESLAKAKVKSISTTGTKSHARVREEMRKKLEKNPTRTEVYLECHQHEKEAAITNQIKNIANGQGEHEVTLDNDPVSKILGKDQYGRVRGLGLLGVKPSDFAEPSIPSSCKGLNMSNKDEAAVLFYLRKLESLTQRLRKRVKKQGKTIFKLKRKFQDLYGSDFDDDSDITYSDSEEEQDSHHIPPNDKGQSTSSHSIDSPLPHHSTT